MISKSIRRSRSRHKIDSLALRPKKLGSGSATLSITLRWKCFFPAPRYSKTLSSDLVKKCYTPVKKVNCSLKSVSWNPKLCILLIRNSTRLQVPFEVRKIWLGSVFDTQIWRRCMTLKCPTFALNKKTWEIQFHKWKFSVYPKTVFTRLFLL